MAEDYKQKAIRVFNQLVKTDLPNLAKDIDAFKRLIEAKSTGGIEGDTYLVAFNLSFGQKGEYIKTLDELYGKIHGAVGGNTGQGGFINCFNWATGWGIVSGISRSIDSCFQEELLPIFLGQSKNTTVNLDHYADRMVTEEWSKNQYINLQTKIASIRKSTFDSIKDYNEGIADINQIDITPFQITVALKDKTQVTRVSQLNQMNMNVVSILKNENNDLYKRFSVFPLEGNLNQTESNLKSGTSFEKYKLYGYDTSSIGSESINQLKNRYIQLGLLAILYGEIPFLQEIPVELAIYMDKENTPHVKILFDKKRTANINMNDLYTKYKEISNVDELANTLKNELNQYDADILRKVFVGGGTQYVQDQLPMGTQSSSFTQQTPSSQRVPSTPPNSLESSISLGGSTKKQKSKTNKITRKSKK